MKSYSRLALCIPLAFVAVLFLAGSNLNRSDLKLLPGQPAVLAAQSVRRRPIRDPIPQRSIKRRILPTRDLRASPYTTEAPPPPGDAPDPSRPAASIRWPSR